MRIRPQPGQLYAFRTKVGTHRHAVLKIIGASSEMIAVAVLDGLWSRTPTVEEARESGVLAEHRFPFSGRSALFGLNANWWDPTELLDQSLLGTAHVSPEEAEAAHRILHVRLGCQYTVLSVAAGAAEAEWRWVHDREA